MAKKKIKTIPIQSGVSPNFLEGTLTEDISPLAALFDLIDNSIDGARDNIFKSGSTSDIYGLPANYSGYKIHIRIDSDSIRIVDNCLGLDEAVLTKKAFSVAATSNHSFGIGHYGLGLKRSLLKLGSSYAMSTDTGDVAFKMHFDSENFGGATEKKLFADQYESSGKRKVLFSASKLKRAVKYEISDSRWFENACKELSVRYAIYVSKGLDISLHSVIHNSRQKIESFVPTLRSDGKFLPTKRTLRIDGVDVYIESGIHQHYKFPTEKQLGYSLAENRKLTEDFGLYFVCNDRIIVSSSTAPEHGWKTKWHSEYNGFVCWIRFVSQDSSLMPWNTAKTALKTDSTLFLKVRDELQPIADFYRQDIKRRYGKEKTPSVLLAAAEKPIASVRANPGQAEYPKAKDNTHLHVKNWTTLLPKNFPHSDDNVLNAYIVEAIELEISSAPYAAAMLYRSMLEAAFTRYVRVTNNFQTVKDHFYTKGEGKKKRHSEEYKKEQDLNLSMIMAWLADSENSSLFKQEIRAKLKLALRKSKEHISFLNGVVHCKQLMNHARLADIRNDTIDLFQFAVTHGLN